MPILLPDGSERFVGLEQQAANAGVAYMYESHRGIDGIKVMGTLRFHAEAVRVDKPEATSPTTLCNSEFRSNLNPDGPDRYIVTVSFRTFFGIETGSATAHICRYQD